eukprot:CAMPEP_0204641476 /NCGR_PEP_ID=MMETSP0717-20131115/51151_1 /ASSEMBLY_ACC=CAM_ASM_000666 /TAXON_ID=230516 /ORGANISM="Chaetoceros curvisetus" /LENGTH=268 /DNA_ID=CAMNT_0051662143 /DNA_START=56 /DNA_END=864 /DNA_ORIENTATION=+
MDTENFPSTPRRTSSTDASFLLTRRRHGHHSYSPPVTSPADSLLLLPAPLYDCHSLDAVFLPSSIKEIGDGAFDHCKNLRILSIPHTINIDNIGRDIIGQLGYSIISRCDTFWHMHSAHLREGNHNQVNQAIIDINHNLPSLHQACLNTNVSTQSIHQYITAHGTAAAYNANYGDGMTPMDILALNPHADASSIMTCFEANMGAAIGMWIQGKDVHGSHSISSALSGKTPLDYLAEYDMESHLSIVAALCRHREAHSATSSSVSHNQS